MSDSISLSVDKNIKLISPNMDMKDAMFALVDKNRAFLNQHISFADNKNTPASIAAFLKEIINFNYGGQKFNLIIVYDDHIAGVIGYHRIYPQDARAEIGYWIGESYQGRGIMAKSMPVFLHYGFEAIGLHRVELLTFTHHHRSIALAERSGFTKEGVLRDYYFMHDKFNDAALYSYLKPAFVKRK